MVTRNAVHVSCDLDERQIAKVLSDLGLRPVRCLRDREQPAPLLANEFVRHSYSDATFADELGVELAAKVWACSRGLFSLLCS
jgi:hypothetical protein